MPYTIHPKTDVILVPGLMRTCASMAAVADVALASGHRTGRFHYSRCDAPAVIQARLQKVIREARRPVVVIGHSYGGLLAVSACRHSSVTQRVSGILCLGAPLRGSASARRLATFRAGRALLDASADLLGAGLDYPRVPARIAMIAGERPHAVGRLVRTLDGPNDGTVAVAETAWPGLTEHIRLPVTHQGLLADRRVLAHVQAYLATGSLLGEAGVPARAA
ncbi:hypothetical protein RHOFW510R12_00510 [Rhodanobacter sp. FW510-R12]|uniref:esterase/lipase family protein n=1 Tax=Rhodanobacter thiooxydans TaxID=416169 RepID=UPI0009112471|nr:alpha/beta fold hydrolase [Rhodanobacter thiooxydans]UJJ56723.1 GPI inositol-deacylase [Rhodanobacter thiooxydans]